MEAAAAERRIYGYADLPLILPLIGSGAEARPEGDVYWRPRRMPRVQYSTGSEAEVRLVYLQAEPRAPGGVSWLPSAPKWVVIDWEATAAPGWRPEYPGLWAIVIPPPPPAPLGVEEGTESSRRLRLGVLSPATGRSGDSDSGGVGVVAPRRWRGGGEIVRFNGTALPIFWLSGAVTEREKEPSLRGGSGSVSSPTVTDTARAPRLDLERGALRGLGVLIRDWASDPFLGWLAGVTLDRLRASEVWGENPAVASEDPVIAGLALLNERRWRSALAALERDDPELGAEVVARATAVVRLPDGSAVAAWPLDTQALDSLRGALLAPGSSKDSRMVAARSWLGSVPAAVAWITDDDAGGIGGGGRGGFWGGFGG